MVGVSYTPTTIARIGISQADSYISNSYASLNSALNPKNTEQRDFIGAGVFLFGGLIGLLIGLGIGYGSKSQASLEIQKELNIKEMDTAGLGTVLDKKKGTSSDKNIARLLDENKNLTLNKKTSEYIAEALDRGFDDKKADLYAINLLIEKEGYVFKEGEDGEIIEKKLYALLKQYNKEGEERGYDGKNVEKGIEDKGNPDSETIGETDLEAEVRNTATLDEAEKSDEEANLDSEAPDPEEGEEE